MTLALMSVGTLTFRDKDTYYTKGIGPENNNCRLIVTPEKAAMASTRWRNSD